MNIWFDFSDGNQSYLLYFIDQNGDPYVFSVSEDHEYRLVIGISHAEYFVDGVDEFAHQDGSSMDPVFSKPEGVYETDLQLTISTSQSGVDIYYTTDGTDPDATSTLYTGIIFIDTTTTIKAIAHKDGQWSNVVSATYTIHPGTPVFSKSAGTYTINVSLTLTSPTSRAEIHYTLDGSTPDISSPIYVDPILIERTTTVKAVATMDGLASSIVSRSYTIFPAAPSFSLAEWITYWDVTPLTITSATTAADIYYTLDGSDPDSSTMLYTGPIDLVKSLTVKAVAELDGVYSAIVSKSYKVYAPQGDVGEVARVVALRGSRYFYGLDYTKGTLHEIDAQDETIVESHVLPYASPVDMELDTATGIVYIIYKFKDKISRFDSNTESFLSEFQIDSTEHYFRTEDMAIAPLSDRIYVVVSANSAPSGPALTILQLSTGTEILVPDETFQGATLVANDTGHVISASLGGSPSRLYRFDVSADTLVEEENIGAGSNGKDLTLSPDGAHLAFACGGGNGSGYTIYDFTPTNFVNVQGEWDLGIYPNYSVFSPDSMYFYGFDGSPYSDGMHVFTVNTYAHLRGIPVLNVGDYVRAAVSPDGQRMVVFTCDRYSGTKHHFWFLSDIRD